MIVEARGIAGATFAQPVTPHRREQAQAMAQWFAEWHPTAVPAVALAK